MPGAQADTATLTRRLMLLGGAAAAGGFGYWWHRRQPPAHDQPRLSAAEAFAAARDGGIILVERMKNNKSSARGILKRLKAYAASVPRKTDKNVDPKPMMTEFRNRSPNFEGPTITMSY